MRINRDKTAGKLRSKAGETIAETLIALLIAALALVMLAGAVTAAKNIIQNNRTAFNSYYAQNELLMKKGDSTEEDTISIGEKDSMTSISDVGVVTFTNNELGDSVTAYRIKKDDE